MDTFDMTADPGYSLLGCQFIRKQLDALARHTQGARTAEDIEDVHQARVASRRMRAALIMFGGCFPDKEFRKWQIRIRKVTQGLGAARDLDVQILFLTSFMEQLTPEERRYRAGIRRLLLRLEQSRTTVQPRVIKVLDKLDESQTLGHMVGTIERLLFDLKTRQVSLESETAQKHCRQHIEARLDDLLSWQKKLADAGDHKSHHAMRIAAKKLRYTLEICNPSFSKQLSDPIKSVKRMQTLLGNIHDCDVWGEQVDRFITQEQTKTLAYYGHDRPFRRLQPGLFYLRDNRRQAREALFTELVTVWQQLEAQLIWDRLRATLHGDVLPQPDATAPAEPDHAPDKEANNTHRPTG
ncbi:CHAD domain-containing protein [Planctomycetota bacterium]